jgi:hypothetical protein
MENLFAVCKSSLLSRRAACGESIVERLSRVGDERDKAELLEALEAWMARTSVPVAGRGMRRGRAFTKSLDPGALLALRVLREERVPVLTKTLLQLARSARAKGSPAPPALPAEVVVGAWLSEVHGELLCGAAVGWSVGDAADSPCASFFDALAGARGSLPARLVALASHAWRLREGGSSRDASVASAALAVFFAQRAGLDVQAAVAQVGGAGGLDALAARLAAAPPREPRDQQAAARRAQLAGLAALLGVGATLDACVPAQLPADALAVLVDAVAATEALAARKSSGLSGAAPGAAEAAGDAQLAHADVVRDAARLEAKVLDAHQQVVSAVGLLARKHGLLMDSGPEREG